MTLFSIILAVVGFGLLFLGGVSGIFLFKRALSEKEKVGDETNIGTLWGLFLLGISIGLAMIWWALR